MIKLRMLKTKTPQLFLITLILNLNYISCVDYAIGKIPYIIDVDQGNVKINVPLDVPDGINEHQPSIELVYTSGNQVNSFLGAGWSLHGLSVIHLCSSQKDAYQNDKLCWDGKFLNENNDEFKTEIDDYSKIVAYKDDSNMIDYFRINTKENKKLKFGGTLQ